LPESVSRFGGDKAGEYDEDEEYGKVGSVKTFLTVFKVEIFAVFRDDDCFGCIGVFWHGGKQLKSKNQTMDVS